MPSSALYCIDSGAPADRFGQCPVHGGVACLVRGWLQVVPDERRATARWRRFVQRLVR